MVIHKKEEYLLVMKANECTIHVIEVPGIRRR